MFSVRSEDVARILGLGHEALAKLPEARHQKQFAYYCPVKVDGYNAFALLDSGNLCSNAISLKFAEQLGYSREQIQPIESLTRVGTAKDGSSLPVCGVLPKPLRLQFGGHPTLFKTRPMVIDGLAMNINISGPYMSKVGLDQIHSKGALSVQGKLIPLLRPGPKRTLASLQRVERSVGLAYVEKEVTVPAQSAAYIPLRIPAVESRLMEPGEGYVEPQSHFVQHTDLHPALSALVRVKDDGTTHTSVLNTLDCPVVVPCGQRFGTYTKVSSIHAAANLPEALTFPKGSNQGQPNHSKKKGKMDESGRTLLTREEMLRVLRLDKSPVLSSPVEREQALDLLMAYNDLFSTGSEYGRTDLVEHEINTTEQAPIRCKSRPINPALEPQLRAQIDQWMKEDVIEPSSSPWSFPLLAVPKKNGKLRWVTDFRRLNEVTIKDAFPLPHIEDNLARLSKSSIFSALDGTGAYHVVPVRKKDREKTAFSTPWGLFQYKRMPFGLANAPSCYSRLVQKVLEGIPPEIATVYLDDTAVHSRTFRGHLKSLARVLEAYRKGGLRLNPEKCQLFQNEIEYLGHVVSNKGISVPPKYTEIIRTWPYPTTVAEVRTFLGKMSYFRKFIPKFSQVAAPLMDFVSQEQVEPIPETPEAMDAFKELKERLISSPILAYPQFDGEPFIVDTDFSSLSLGGVLSQVQDGKERVIAYGARRTNKAERNYSSNKGEILAVIHFLKTWKYYLLHRPFILRTDHSALRWLNTMQEPQGLILRWLDLLANYQFTIEFRAGSKHGNADSLSRTTHGEPCEENEDQEGERAQSMLAPLSMPHLHGHLGLDVLRTEQGKDETLAHIIRYLKEDKWPEEPELRSLDPELRLYVGLRPQLSIKNNLLVREREIVGRGKQMVYCVPRALQAQIMKKCHKDVLHRGENATMDQTAQRFFFPSMSVQAHLTVQQCTVCQRNQKAPKHQKHTLISYSDSHPFSRLSIDFVGPLKESKNGNRYILTMRDCFTRWIEGVACEDMLATTVARTLEKEIFSRYGLPEVVHSDRGANFTSALMKAVYEELNIARTMTPAFSPQSNPVERTHRDLGQLLRASVDEHGQDWEECLPACLWAIRVAKNRSTGYSPFFMLFGRDPALEIDLIYGTPSKEKYGPHQYVNLLRQRLNATFKVARENMQASISRARHQYRENSGGEKLKAGDLVWLFTPSLTQKMGRKLSTVWTGPWKVLDVISPVLMRIQVEGNWNKLPLDSVVAVDRLRRYTCTDPPEIELDLRSSDVNTADEFAQLAQSPTSHTTAPARMPYSGAVPITGGGGGGAVAPTPAAPVSQPPAQTDDDPDAHVHHAPDVTPAPVVPDEEMQSEQGDADEPHDDADVSMQPWQRPLPGDDTVANETLDEADAVKESAKSKPKFDYTGDKFQGFQSRNDTLDIDANDQSMADLNISLDSDKSDPALDQTSADEEPLAQATNARKFSFKRPSSPSWAGLTDTLPVIPEDGSVTPPRKPRAVTPTVSSPKPKPHILPPKLRISVPIPEEEIVDTHRPKKVTASKKTHGIASKKESLLTPQVTAEETKQESIETKVKHDSEKGKKDAEKAAASSSSSLPLTRARTRALEKEEEEEEEGRKRAAFTGTRPKVREKKESGAHGRSHARLEEDERLHGPRTRWASRDKGPGNVKQTIIRDPSPLPRGKKRLDTSFTARIPPPIRPLRKFYPVRENKRDQPASSPNVTQTLPPPKSKRRTSCATPPPSP